MSIGAQAAPPQPPGYQAAHQMRVIAQIGIPLLFVAIVLPLIGQIYLAIFEPPAPAGANEIAARVAVHVLRAVPALLLAWTMFGVVKVLREYEKGQFLSLEASSHLKGVGEGGLIALSLNLAVVPIIVTLIEGGPLVSAIVANPLDICIVMFAACTLSLGSVLESAAKALKADNDQIV